MLPFNNIASGFYANTWFNSLPREEANHKAGIAMSVPFFISAILVPFFGIFIDKFGNRAYLSFVSALFCLFSFGLFYSASPIYAIILLGVTYSLFASVIWPAISLVVQNKYVVRYLIKIGICLRCYYFHTKYRLSYIPFACGLVLQCKWRRLL